MSTGGVEGGKHGVVVKVWAGHDGAGCVGQLGIHSVLLFTQLWAVILLSGYI